MNVQEKLRMYYGAVAVDKRLVSEEAPRSVPSYVGEWLVRRFFTGIPAEEARRRMAAFIAKHLPMPGQREEVKAQLRRLGHYTLIDEFKVFTDLKANRYVLVIPTLDISDAYIDDELVDQHEMLLSGSVWGAGRLLYEPDSLSEQGPMRLRMDRFEPIQMSSFDFELFAERRERFTVEEWREVLIHSQGLNPDAYPLEPQRRILMARLMPIVQKNLNIFELAPKGTGKTYIYKNLSTYTHVISGGAVTPAALFYNLSMRKMPGLLALNDVVVFDEVQSIQFDNPREVGGILKDYMESGSYHRGVKKVSADASLGFLGNIEMSENGLPKHQRWFDALPYPLNESALIHRIHAFLPGWHLPKIDVADKALTRELGLAADYLSEALHRLRNQDGHEQHIVRRVKVRGTQDIRDEKAVQRVATALFKLLFPHGKATDDELMFYCVEPAIEYRQYVRDQLTLRDEEFPPFILSADLREAPDTFIPSSSSVS
jgi:ATP-dependent Lon protease